MIRILATIPRNPRIFTSHPFIMSSKVSIQVCSILCLVQFQSDMSHIILKCSILSRKGLGRGVKVVKSEMLESRWGGGKFWPCSYFLPTPHMFGPHVTITPPDFRPCNIPDTSTIMYKYIHSFLSSTNSHPHHCTLLVLIDFCPVQSEFLIWSFAF